MKVRPFNLLIIINVDTKSKIFSVFILKRQ